MSESIVIRNLTKKYPNEEGEKVALGGIDLTIEEGDIYGIIGLSGAGKSTLVRCINGLERYDGGSLKVNGREVADLHPKDLRALRGKVGMIFQSFNLMPSRTVAANVALAFRGKGDEKSRNDRVLELLDLVGLSEKAEAYPSELSGGQQQRVAIARALVNKPNILLSDEATSALDPATTKSILALLRNLHDALGLTVVIITHQMSVIKQVCNKVAVIDHGTIVEKGDVFDIFADPQAPLTKSFIDTTSSLGKVRELLDDHSSLVQPGPGQVLLRMNYVAKDVSEALVSHISRRFTIDVNIIFADIDIVDGAPLGGLVVMLKGEASNVADAISYLNERHIGIEVIDRA